MPTTPATSSSAAQPTSDPDDSSAETGTESTTTSTKRWNRALTSIDLETLSARSQAIRIEIGELMPDGYRLNEIATELGVTPSWVSQRLDELRSEIILQTGGFLPLTDTEYAALKDSIAQHGQQVPILVGSSGLLDGKHRLLCLRELGIAEVLVQFVIDQDPETERRISRTVNAARRMLNRAQKEALVRAELHHNWQRSSRQIALDCGCSHHFVETIRDAIRTERATMHDEPPLEIPADDPLDQPIPVPPLVPPPPPRNQDSRQGSDGRQFPPRSAYKQRPKGSTVPREKILATVTCSHGQEHHLHSAGPIRTRRYWLTPLEDDA
ncbi:MAG: ParB N-terminal domain-containing protein, partial [bacterium]